MKHLHWGGNEERPEGERGRYAPEQPEDDDRVRRPRGERLRKTPPAARIGTTRSA
jgi:hypothetical protein